MNGKIKTKFAALFAVALMITVCVVPMVGGSEDVEAATTTETVTISGNVYAADGTTGIVGAVVYVGSYSTTAPQAVTTTSGAFTIKDVPVGDVIVNILNTDSEKPAYGLDMPTISVDDVDSDLTGLKFVAGTVQITGQLVKKTATTNNAIYLEGLNVTDGTDTVTTDKNGKYSFLAAVGTPYTLTATDSTSGITFSTGSFVASPTASVQNLKATAEIIDATVSAPVGIFRIDPSTKGTITAIGAPCFGYDGKAYHAYAVLTYGSTASEASEDTDVKFIYGTPTDSYAYGIGESKTVEVAKGVAKGVDIVEKDIDVKLTVGSIISGKAYVGVGDDKVEMDLDDVGSDKIVLYTEDEYIDAYISSAFNMYFVGTVLDEDTTLTNYKISCDDIGDYRFSDITSGDFTANNSVKVSGVIGADAEIKFTIASSGDVATNLDTIVVSTDEYYLTESKGAYSFYLPEGMDVTITPLAENITVTPSEVKYDEVNADTVIQAITVYKEVEYKGKVLLNGIAVGEEAYLDTTNFPFTGVANINWVEVKGEDPYYTFKSNASPEKISLEANALNTDYTYVAKKGVVAKVASPGVMTDIVINTVEQTQKVVDAKGLGIKGVKVDFKMFDGNDYSIAKKIIDLGSATTDGNGDAKVKFTIPKNGYGVKVIVSSDSEYGKYTFSNEGVYGYSASSIYATESTYYGYYTSNGSSLKGFGMSYVAKSGDNIVDFGVAKIVDNMYYILAPASAGSSIVTLNVTLDKGFTTDVTNEDAVSLTLSVAGRKDITAFALAEDNSVEVEILENEYFKFIKVNEYPADHVKGDVIVLSAEKTCYRLQNGGLQYEYTDAAVEYKFAGWYVNGKLLTEDCDTAITLSEDVVIVAQYDEAVKVIGSQDVPEAGLDTNVLILGIVVVVIALIAVVYSVISKRD